MPLFRLHHVRMFANAEARFGNLGNQLHEIVGQRDSLDVLAASCMPINAQPALPTQVDDLGSQADDEKDKESAVGAKKNW